MRISVIAVLVAGVLALAACEQFFRPIVISPQITIVVNEDEESRPATSPSTRNIALPICYLAACDGLSGDECAAEALRNIRDRGSSVWSSFAEKPRAILTFAERGFYVQLDRRVSYDAARGAWAELGCLRGAESTAAEDARHRLCVRNMSSWVDVANNSGTAELSLDTEYRRVCLRDTPE